MAYLYWAHLIEHTNCKTQGYIGVTTNTTKRWSQHRQRQDCLHFGRAIALYGKENIIFEILFDGPLEGCYQLEEYFRPTENIGWNIRVGGKAGSGMTGKQHTKESIQKMKLAKKGTIFTKEHRENMGKARAKLCDVFDYTTKEKIATNVLLPEWAKANGYDRRCLAGTVTDKRRNQHKGIYIKYKELHDT